VQADDIRPNNPLLPVVTDFDGCFKMGFRVPFMNENLEGFRKCFSRVAAF